MFKKIFTILSFAVISCTASNNFQPSPVIEEIPIQSKIEWRKLDSRTSKEIETTDKPVLVYLSNESCYSCRLLETVTLSDPDVITLVNDNFLPIHVDGDEAFLTLQEFKFPLEFPTIIIAKHDKLARLVGFMTVQEFSTKIIAIKDELTLTDSNEEQE